MERRKEIISLSVIIVAVIGVIGLTTIISSSLFKSLTTDNNSYVLRGIADTYIPVINEVDNKIKEPIMGENISIEINFYEVNGTKEGQEKSLIKYDRTYMPSTGILYGSDKEFDCLSIAEGEVTSIDESEMFGSIVTVKHNNNLISKYSSLSSVNVKVGDTVNAGEVIGKSGQNKVSTSKSNMLMIELTLNGEYVNPTKYYNVSIDQINAN